MSDPISGVKNLTSAIFDTVKGNGNSKKAQTEMSPDAFYANMMFPKYFSSGSVPTASTNGNN